MKSNSINQTVIGWTFFAILCAAIVLGGCASGKKEKKQSQEQQQESKADKPTEQPDKPAKQPAKPAEQPAKTTRSHGYLGAVVHTKKWAESVKCKTRLSTLYKDLEMYAVINEAFPASLAELIDSGSDPQLLKCPAPNGQEYVYIPGHEPAKPSTIILVYERDAVHDGKCHVLRLDGQVDALSPEQLSSELSRTQKYLGQR